MCSAKAEENQRPRRWLSWLVLGCLVVVGAVAAPWIWRQVAFYRHMRTAKLAFSKFAADNAVFELTLAEQLRPESAEVQFLLGVANRKAGHIDDVRHYLDQAAKLGWPKKDVRFQLTLLAFQAGDSDAEAELKEMALRPMDDDTAEQLYESFALGYLSQYRASDGLFVLDGWSEWRPDCIRPRLLRAEIYDLTSQRVKVEEEYRKILEADPENYAGHLGLAHVLEQNHDNEQALAHFRFCHEQFPADPGPSLGIATCLQQEGKLDEAREALDAILAQKLPGPQRAMVLAELAKIAQQRKDLETAVKLMSEAVELDPHSSQMQMMLGVCLGKVGRTKEAKKYVDRSQEIDRLQERRSDLELEMLSRPNDPKLRFEIGELLAKLDYPKPAAAMMLTVLRWDPSHQGAHAALVKYYDDIKRPDLADKHRAALEQPPQDAALEQPPQDAALEQPPQDARWEDGSDTTVVDGPLAAAGHADATNQNQ